MVAPREYSYLGYLFVNIKSVLDPYGPISLKSGSLLRVGYVSTIIHCSGCYVKSLNKNNIQEVALPFLPVMQTEAIYI